METSFWRANTNLATGILGRPSLGETQPAGHLQIPGAAEGGLGELQGSLEALRTSYLGLMRAQATAIEQHRTVGHQLDADRMALRIEEAKALPDAGRIQELRVRIASAEATQPLLAQEIEARQVQIAQAADLLIDGGLHPSQVTASGLFQSFDGRNVLVPGERPADFGSNNPPTFLQWHSSLQTEWMVARLDADRTTQIVLGGTTLNFMLSNDNKTVIALDQLGLSDIAKLSPADQTSLTESAAWTGIASRLNLQRRDDLPGTLGALKGTTAMVNLANEITNATGMPLVDRTVFRDQLDLLFRRANASQIVSSDLLDQAVGELGERFRRALAFGTAPVPEFIEVRLYNVDGDDSELLRTRQTQALYNPVSTDMNATINKGYAEFMRAERAIRAAAVSRDAMSPITGGFRDARVDVPNLIFRLQSLYENAAEGVADAGTEEIAQLHELLNDYAIMQRLINETVKSFNPAKTDEVRRFMNVGDDDGLHDDQNKEGFDVLTQYFRRSSSGTLFISSVETDEEPRYPWFSPGWGIGDGGDKPSVRNLGSLLTNEEMRAFSMFASDSFTNAGSSKHPIETLLGLTRPLQDFVGEGDDDDNSLKRLNKTRWDTFGTQLSDAVTQLNQKNQIKQNDVEDATKQRNRHFELGNNALAKMNDMLQAIGRM